MLNGREILSSPSTAARDGPITRHDGEELRLAVGERSAYTVVTRFDPAANSALELYMSHGMGCTQ